MKRLMLIVALCALALPCLTGCIAVQWGSGSKHDMKCMQERMANLEARVAVLEAARAPQGEAAK